MRRYQEMMKKRKTVLIMAIPVVIAAAFLIGELIFVHVYTERTLPENYQKLVMAGDYDTANELYAKRISKNEKALAVVSEKEDTAIDTIDKDFTNSNISYEEALNALTLYEKLTSSKKKAETVKEHITLLNDSHIAYKAGMDAEAEGEDEKALKEYKAVSTQDELYTVAQERIRAVTERLKDKGVSKAQALADKGQYEEAIKVLSETVETYGDSDAIKSALYECRKALVATSLEITAVNKWVDQPDIFNGDIGSKVRFTLRITNKTKKDISSIAGCFTVSDADMNTLISKNIELNRHVIAAGQTFDESDYYYEVGAIKPSDLDKTLVQTPYEALRFDFDVKKITFADGTSQSIGSTISQ